MKLQRARRHRSFRSIPFSLAFLAVVLAGPAPAYFSSDSVDGNESVQPQLARRHGTLVIPGDVRPAVLYADGSTLMTEWETVWRQMCGDGRVLLSADQLGAIARDHAIQANARGIGGNDSSVEIGGGAGMEEGESGGTADGGFHVTFALASSVPQAARPAFERIRAYIEHLFSDPISVRVTVSFMTLPPGILGATEAEYTRTSWNIARTALRNDMDGNDSIQDDLPIGSTIPIRFNGNSTAVTNETRVFWTLANFKAAVGLVSGNAASMVFNTNFTWDFDPSNGVNGYSFEDVVIHEMAHVLGFSSAIDNRNNDIEVMDIFRFQRSSGAGNPRTTAEFKHMPRLVSFNRPDDDHCVDLLAQEYRMSDGDPCQASHFRYQTPVIGLMTPRIDAGWTRYPNFYSQADLNVLDAIGYDR